ncbi:MAG TPA: YetF domain-containing protein [Povalibacter sp.]|nr:YetF domain-containing protein [Povalibacter sp.]
MNVQWHEMFAIHVAPLDLVVRGTLIYWFLFLVFRFVMRRDVGSMAVSDILLLVIIADAAQNAMADDYKSISEGLILISTILGWNFLLDWAGWRFRWMRRFLHSPRVLLIRDGKVLEQNLSREMITDDDLLNKLHEHGIEKASQVKRAWLEADGEISVIKAR